MDNLNRYKRALNVNQDEVNKRQRIIDALSGSTRSNDNFLLTSAAAATGMLPASLGGFSLPPTAGTMGLNALNFRQQFLLPTAAAMPPQPRHMAAALQQAAMDEMMQQQFGVPTVGNFGGPTAAAAAAGRMLGEGNAASNSSATTTGKQPNLRDLILARQQSRKEVEDAQELLLKKQEEQKKQETQFQAALLFNGYENSAFSMPPSAAAAAGGGVVAPSAFDTDRDELLQQLDAKTLQLAHFTPSIRTFAPKTTIKKAMHNHVNITDTPADAPPLGESAALITQPSSQSFKNLKNPPSSSASTFKDESSSQLQCLPVGTGNKDFDSLGTEEDSNWLSEMHCFLRSEIVEVFHVENSKLTGRSTSKGLSAKQVGIRCRWCADMPPESRVSRSSAFPSSLRQLYQSFTMMVRDHFGPHNMCTAIPLPHREHLNKLRHSRNSQGASDSKHYWVHAANKIGMVDSDEGIQITEESKAEGRKMENFGAPAEDVKKPEPVVLLVKPEDIPKGSMFLYTLFLQTQLVRLQKSELVAKRRTLPEGLEGIGCRHCCAAGRYGFSRRFPLRRRSLPEEVMDMYSHMKRCPLCPKEVKDLLERLHGEHERAKMLGTAGRSFPGGKDGRGKDPHREFFDVIWQRLQRSHDIKT